MNSHKTISHLVTEPTFPAWLVPGILLYSCISIGFIFDSAYINITDGGIGREVVDGWTITLAWELITEEIKFSDTGRIARKITTKTLHFIFGLLIGLTVIALLKRKRGSSTASYIITQFQLIVGLAFFYYYPQDKEEIYLLFGGILTALSILQYWALSRPNVRKWLRSYNVEFFSIQSSNPVIRDFVVYASIRKAIASLVLGFQLFIMAFVAYHLLPELSNWLFRNSVVTFVSIESTFVNIISSILTPFLVLFTLIFPILVLYPTLTVVAAFWRHPSRILLLRPFHAPDSSKTLKNIIQDSIGFLAHVYTISDTEINQRWYIRWPIALPHLWLLHFHTKHIKKEKSIDQLERKIRKTFSRNINWFASPGKLFSIPTSMSMWKPTVNRLISATDAILFDISNPSENIAWELNQININNRTESIIFVTIKSEAKKAIEFLHLQGINCELGVNIFTYSEEGIELVDQFTKRFAHFLGAKSYEATQKYVRHAIATTIFIGILGAGASLFVHYDKKQNLETSEAATVFISGITPEIAFGAETLASAIIISDSVSPDFELINLGLLSGFYKKHKNIFSTQHEFYSAKLTVWKKYFSEHKESNIKIFRSDIDDLIRLVKSGKSHLESIANQWQRQLQKD